MLSALLLPELLENLLGRVAMLGGAALVCLGMIVAPTMPAYAHRNLPADHPHLAQAQGDSHRHVFVIDDLHNRWPRP
jgi:hypothetical protein